MTSQALVTLLWQMFPSASMAMWGEVVQGTCGMCKLHIGSDLTPYMTLTSNTLENM